MKDSLLFSRQTLKKLESTLRYIISLEVDNFDNLSRVELEYKLRDAIFMARRAMNLPTEKIV